MNNSDVIPPSVAGCLAEIERSVQRFRSCYSLGIDPERSLTDEIITMRFELIRLWSEISRSEKAFRSSNANRFEPATLKDRRDKD